MLMAVLALGAAALAQNPVPYVNAPLSPGSKAPGAAAFTLTVNGTGFVSGATVYWNGSSRTTTFVKSTKLTASINASDVATAGTANITVLNPAPGGGLSNVAHFEIIKSGYTVAYAKTDYATDLTPQDVATADFNGDGKLDLAVATGNNSVSVLLGNGTGAFPTHVEYPVPGHPIAIVAGDFNGDGKMDVATVDEYQSEISVLLGNGDGTFQAHQEYATGNHPVALATADVNGDGYLDIVVCDLNDNKVAVLLGNGDGTFKNHVDYATGTGPSGVAIGDFNNDGKLDLVVANNGDNTVAILAGNGDGTFQGPTAFPTAILPNSVVVGDFNGDGNLDVAAGTSNKSVSVLLGSGNGTLQNHKEYTIGANSVVVAAADVSGDGKLDLISADYNDNTVSTLVGNGDGTFKGRSVFPTAGGPSGLAVGDFNNNGKLDIAAAANTNNTVSVILDSMITLSPNVLGFGKVTSGFKTAAKVVTVKNTGTTSYTLGSPTIVGASNTDFTDTTTCGTTLAAGKTCTYSVVFDPQACEVADAQLLLTSNGSSLGALLTGTGNIPITLTPRTQTFPTTAIGSTSAAKTNTFTNDSGVNIVFTNIDLEGVNQTDFHLASTGCLALSGSILAPGKSCTSSVTFSPTITPAQNETVTQVYYGNFCLAKQGLLINGEGTGVTISPKSINFGTIAVGKTGSKTVTFKNVSSQPITISSVNFSASSPVFDLQSNTCGFVQGSQYGTVQANSSCTLTVGFTPAASGAITGSMSIGDNDITGPQSVSLSGTGQ